MKKPEMNKPEWKDKLYSSAVAHFQDEGDEKKRTVFDEDENQFIITFSKDEAEAIIFIAKNYAEKHPA